MAQNTSHAVMSQRVEPLDSLYHFPTPPWGTRALCEWLKDKYTLKKHGVWEPAAGAGDMARPLSEYFEEVYASDVHDYGCGYDVVDFLDASRRDDFWIITNPPFRLAEQFAMKAIERALFGSAMLVRTSFLESTGRYSRLFSQQPPTDILQFSERLPMHKGRLLANGSTATSYCWLVWQAHLIGKQTNFHWIPPCRKRLERAEDYA